MDVRVAKLLDRIEERLADLNLSDRKASLEAVGKPDMIRDIRRGRMPAANRLNSLADVLGASAEYLLGETDILPAASQSMPRVVPRIQEMPKDIPVYGTAIGADASFMSEVDQAVAIEQIDLDYSDVIDRFRRPPLLAGRKDVYGLYVAGTSMEPAFESGRGILVDPKRPPAVRDYVVVYIAPPGSHADMDGVRSVLLKRLVRRSASYIELAQFEPATTFRVPTKVIQAMHRVMPWDEAFGM
jgi:hypothetical protein